MARFPLRPEPAGLTYIDRATPPDWKVEFGFEGPLELEIGAGAGGFAVEYARRNPGIRFVAIEWRKKYAREIQFRGTKLGLKNLIVIEGDARAQLPKLFTPGSLAAIHLQFPDPWWKRSHHKRAILQPDFTKFLLTLLEPGGRFDFRTDVEERARQGLAILEASGLHNPLGAGAFHPYDPEEVPSTRERRYLVSQQPVFRARLVKPRS